MPPTPNKPNRQCGPHHRHMQRRPQHHTHTHVTNIHFTLTSHNHTLSHPTHNKNNHTYPHCNHITLQASIDVAPRTETLRKQSPERAPVKAPLDDIPVKAPPGNLPRPPPRADSDRQVSPPLKAPPATDPDTLAGRWRTSVDMASSPYLARLAACDD